MNKQRDLELVLRSRMPIVAIQSRDESRILDLIKNIAIRQPSDNYVPLFRWSITDGLQRLDIDLEPQPLNSEPADVLKHIRAVDKAGIYVLLDFHPYMEDPVNVRLLKDICIRFRDTPRHLILVSHELKMPKELEQYSAQFEMALPDEAERQKIIKKVAAEWKLENPGQAIQFDPKAYKLLIHNLAGLTAYDTAHLARNAVFQDGAITRNDLPGVMQAKYDLLNRGGILNFEYDTVHFGEVGGLGKLKVWLKNRRAAFSRTEGASHLDTPKGMLLIGVQGCGKSLAAKATAGILGVPILRLDFATLYNKYHGETERNLRESLKTADVMSPCVLWIDEIEKGLAGRGGETGTTQRVLGSFLTWMAEKNSSVFVVATANDISLLPPELVRKGRFDEIFFVDLPDATVRRQIIEIHLAARDQASNGFDLESIVQQTSGFSGAELEQIIVSALYAAHAQQVVVSTEHLLEEARNTRPLSIVMAERIGTLRQWAANRTVSAH